MDIRINCFLKKWSAPGMWAAGGLTAAALILERVWSECFFANALYIAAAILAGGPILYRAVQGLRFKTVGIELLVSIAVLGAFWIAELSEAAIVTFLFQFGSFLEQKTMKKTRSAIKALMQVAPSTAWRIDGDNLEEIGADEVEEGDLLLVKTGGQIAADGIVVQGEGYVNEASITGESEPRHKTVGASLYAGTFLDSGTLRMEATKVGEDTTFARIIALVEEAQDAKSPAERFIDRFARYYTPTVVVMAALIFLLLRNLDTAITVLVLACPGALVIGAPIANVAGIGRGAQEGVLLKGGDSVHTFAKTDTIVFDKTGTLTVGRPSVGKEILYSGKIEQILSLAASAERMADHPLARAIMEYAEQKGLAQWAVLHADPQKGLGLQAQVEGHRVLVGNARLMEGHNIVLPENVRADLEQTQAEGMTAVLIAVDEVLCMLLGISDGIKPDASQSIQELKRAGIRHLVMLTGDNPTTAEAVAHKIGLEEFYGELLPQDKLEWIQSMRREGHVVTFVGDGINDSPALTAADTGIAMGSGTDVAIDSSDVVLIRSDLASITIALKLAKRTVGIMYQNIAIAVGTVIFLMAGLFAGYIHMAVGMLVHEASILAVILNAMRLLIFNRRD